MLILLGSIIVYYIYLDSFSMFFASIGYATLRNVFVLKVLYLRLPLNDATQISMLFTYTCILNVFFHHFSQKHQESWKKRQKINHKPFVYLRKKSYNYIKLWNRFLERIVNWFRIINIVPTVFNIMIPISELSFISVLIISKHKPLQSEIWIWTLYLPGRSRLSINVLIIRRPF